MLLLPFDLTEGDPTCQKIVQQVGGWIGWGLCNRVGCGPGVWGVGVQLLPHRGGAGEGDPACQKIVQQVAVAVQQGGACAGGQGIGSATAVPVRETPPAGRLCSRWVGG